MLKKLASTVILVSKNYEHSISNKGIFVNNFGLKSSWKRDTSRKLYMGYAS